MSLPPKSSLLTDGLSLLVKHFGVQRVQAALTKISRSLGGEVENSKLRSDTMHGQRSTGTKGTQALEFIREIDPEKYALLSEFLLRVRKREILLAPQDIRYFAQRVGLKEINGKSREDLIPKLMRFLIGQPIDRLRIDLASASDISEQQRNMGFSVLTDKLVGRR